MYTGPSESGKKGFKQASLVPLSGEISVVKDSKVATTSSDLRKEISPGDIIKILDQQYSIVAPQVLNCYFN